MKRRMPFRLARLNRSASSSLPGALSLVLLSVFSQNAAAQEERPQREEPAESPQRFRGRRDVRDLAEDEARRDFDRDCLRSGCHARLNTRPWVHAPVSLGACENCHEPEGEETAHRFRPARRETELCVFCHRLDPPQQSVHAAYKNGQCVGCHDPHGGETPALLKALDVSTLCAECHDARMRPIPAVLSAPQTGDDAAVPESELRIPYAHLHAPVAEGKCTDCHVWHQSEHDGLLVREERTLCLGCHEETLTRLDSAAHVHQPLTSDCTSCHFGHGGDDSRLLRGAPRELCLSCHADVLRPQGDLVLHAPVRVETSCLECHVAHAAANPRLLVSSLDAVCIDCHDERIELAGGTVITDVAAEIRNASHVHTPVGEGSCISCHAGHASAHGNLLVREERTLCLDCHEETMKQLTSAAHIHQPLTSECASCHFGHGSDNPMLLRGAPRELCLSCHADVLRLQGGLTLHAPVRGETSCLECHVAHAAPDSRLLVPSPGAVCIDCHDERIELVGGALIADIAAEIRDASHVHAPVAEEDCVSCHTGHASAHGDLLKSPYPRGLYAAFGEPAYELCFSCHDPRLAAEERTTVTAFRDGDRNLHALHVRGTKGRTCATCHTSHASELPALLRKSLLFGPRRWEVPIGFRRSETGGACAPGCHQEFHYSNQDPPPEERATSSSSDAPPGPTEH